MWMNTQIVALNLSANAYYTPWFPKAADNAVFTMEKILDTISAGTAVAVSVRTKNREAEGGDGSLAASFVALSGNFWEAKCTDLLELVRFKITFTAGSIGQGLIYRFLGPTWYETAVSAG